MKNRFFFCNISKYKAVCFNMLQSATSSSQNFYKVPSKFFTILGLGGEGKTSTDEAQLLPCKIVKGKVNHYYSMSDFTIPVLFCLLSDHSPGLLIRKGFIAQLFALACILGHSVSITTLMHVEISLQKR